VNKEGKVEWIRGVLAARGGERTVTASTKAVIGKHIQLEINPPPNRKPVEVLQVTRIMLSTTNT
jgi:hypothetical protein